MIGSISSTYSTFVCPTEGLSNEDAARFGVLKSLSPGRQTQEKIASFARNLFSILLFPWGVCRLVSFLFSKIVALAVLPATWTRPKRSFGEPYSIAGESVVVTTPDRVKIEGFFVDKPEAKKCILFCNGNNGSIRGCLNRVQNIHPNTCTLSFNYRGVGASQGTPHGTDLALDVYAMAMWLITEKGFDPEDILIYGTSLGGAAGALGAELIQKAYPDKKISFCSDRSFTKLSSATYHLMTNKLPSLISILCARFASWAIVSTSFELDAVSALQSLKGRIIIISHPKDPIIIPKAQLTHAELPGQDVVSITLDSQIPSSDTDQNPHTRHLNEQEKGLFYDAVTPIGFQESSLAAAYRLTEACAKIAQDTLSMLQQKPA